MTKRRRARAHPVKLRSNQEKGKEWIAKSRAKAELIDRAVEHCRREPDLSLSIKQLSFTDI